MKQYYKYYKLVRIYNQNITAVRAIEYIRILIKNNTLKLAFPLD